MVLIIKTARRLSDELLLQIQAIELKLIGIGSYKKGLKEVNME